jgi:siroheme synthase
MGAAGRRNLFMSERIRPAHFVAGGDQPVSVDKTNEGKRVVRLKGGDPFVLEEEVKRLKHWRGQACL